MQILLLKKACDYDLRQFDEEIKKKINLIKWLKKKRFPLILYNPTTIVHS